MDTSTHEVRLASWKSVVEQCQLRPEGLTIASWCKQNGVNVKQYYYWQRRVRRKAAQDTSSGMPPVPVSESGCVSFAEISVPIQPSAAVAAPCLTPDFHPEAVIRRGDLIIGLKNSVSDRLLDRILKGVSHAG